MDKIYHSLFEHAKKYGQQHLMRFWNDLDVVDQVKLSEQINQVDIERVNSLFRQANVHTYSDNTIEPIEDDMIGSSESSPTVLDNWRDIGKEAIARNEVAVILLAGGQGTRLGSEEPKALYDVGLPSKKTLLELQGERIKKLEEMCEGKLSWYIMTSPATHEAMNMALNKLYNIGLEPEQVKLFSQGTLPCLSDVGDILLKDRSTIASNPDGNGGLFRALQENDILNHMKNRGIKHVYVYCVDNILAKVADPEFIGFCISRNADCGNKVVKRVEGESVGVTCLLNGKPGVIEYSELSSEIREKRTASGELVFGAANICIHYFKVDFLCDVAERELSMPIHLARKKIPHISECGNFVQPDSPNGVKLEKFIFDVFRFVDPEKFVVYKCNRIEEFAPLKNAEGEEGTPLACREAVFKLHAGWLLKAGAELVGPDGSSSLEEIFKHAKVEVSPRVSYGGEGLSQIVCGKLLSWPLHLTENKQYF